MNKNAPQPVQAFALGETGYALIGAQVQVIPDPANPGMLAVHERT